ncbi:MAG: RNA polymerase sigma factor [Bryobacteraceae bacterium]
MKHVASLHLGGHRAVEKASEEPQRSLGEDLRKLEQEVVELYDEHSTGLFRYALVITRSRELAQDAVQEAFLRYFLNRRDGTKIQSSKAWLFRVLQNYLVDRLRHGGAKDEVGIGEAVHFADRRENPESHCLANELEAELSNVLAPRELQCMKLKVEGLSYNVLGISSGTVGALLTRAVSKLRKSLGNKREQE